MKTDALRAIIHDAPQSTLMRTDSAGAGTTIKNLITVLTLMLSAVLDLFLDAYSL